MDTSTLNVPMTMYIHAVYIKSKIYKAGGLDSVGDWEHTYFCVSCLDHSRPDPSQRNFLSDMMGT